MNETSWLEHPALKDMDPEKKKILLALISNTKGKPMTQTVPLIIAAMDGLKKKGLSFNETERELIFDILSQDLSPSEKMKVQKLKSFMH